jgi:hypothetical protein
MIFWVSAEVARPAFSALDRVGKCVAPSLNAAFSVSKLVSISMELRYIPIDMPKDMHARYPARSRLKRKEGVCDCTPILD